MTTATAPATKPEIFEERWHMAVDRGAIKRYSNTGDIDVYMTKRWERIQYALEDIAVLLTTDGLSDDDYDGGEDSLRRTTERIWDAIHDELITWATRDEERRLSLFHKTA